MNSKNNRHNHDFQIAYFLAGSCHTPDGAYSLLCDLLEDRQIALRNAEATDLRSQAKRVRAEKKLRSDDEAEQLEGRADIAEIEAFVEVTIKNLAAARAEVETIQKCMAVLDPMRRFAHLPAPQAHEAAQHDEWKLELLHRAENQLLMTGSIPPDLLGTMRMHPSFAEEIWPAVEEMSSLLKTEAGASKLMLRIAVKPFTIPMLANESQP